MANAIKTVTYILASGKYTAPMVFNTEHKTVQLIIDYTDQGVDAWEKFVDIRTAAGSERTLSLGTGIVTEVLLESGDLESGITIIQPFAIDEPYARREWPQRPLPVGAALGNTVNNTTLKQDLIDFFQHYLDDMDASLAIKSVTVTTLEPGEEATVSVIREADGTSYIFGIPRGLQGEQGIQGLKGNQWRGSYSGDTAYVVDDVVSYQGSSYICILASTNNLPTNATYWSLFATTGTAIASNVTNTPSGNISATNVQTAINELDSEKVDKLMATNLITNGDFSNGTTGWLNIGLQSFTVENKEATILANSQFDTLRSVLPSFNLSDKIYASVSFKTSSNLVKVYIRQSVSPFSEPVLFTHKGDGNYEKFSRVSTIPNVLADYRFEVRDERTSGYDNIFIQYALVINLTTLFGAGNEPTKEQMDALLSVYPNSWFNGTSEIGSIGALMRATLGEQIVTPTLLNSRTGTAQYIITKEGFVHFRGTASGGSLNTDIFVLPESIRPTATRTFPISANNAFGVITVSNAGLVRQTVGALTNVSLDGIIFKVGV